MKNIFSLLTAAVVLFCIGCTKSDFEESYTDPSKISKSTVEKQFTGFLVSNRGYVVPDYWNYFVVLRTTLNRYNQAVGWVNSSNQYVPGNAGITDRWNAYYNFLAQYRELEKIYSGLSDQDKTDMRIFMIAATIYFYDHTQKVVDLHGDIPWTEAGKLSSNGGDYQKSYPKYDKAEDIYTKMLDDLKTFADELSTITVKSAILTGFKNQDIINRGDLDLWKRYNNSLRLRMLTRVSAAPAFQSRVETEITSILSDPTKYPLVTDNAQNIQINVYNLSSDINAKGFRTGLEDWDGNVAGKALIDHMKTNADPRLRAMFEPGANANGAYLGLDPLLNESEQTALVAGGTLSRYNRSTLGRNEYFPGVLVTAAEVHFLIAEANLRSGKGSEAKSAYNKGIEESIKFYYWLRTLSADNTAGPLMPTSEAEVAAYLAEPQVNWDNAGTEAEKLSRIATQKWIHFSVVQPVESWAEIRRLNAPSLNFATDNANNQKQPPIRWLYPSSEKTYNTENYNAVSSKDDLITPIFWDVQ